MAISGISALGDSVTQAVSGRSSPTAPTAPGSTSGPSFAQTLGQVVNDAIGTLQTGEAAAIQGIQARCRRSRSSNRSWARSAR